MLVLFSISKALLCTGFESGGAVCVDTHGAFSTRIDPGTSLAPTSTPFTSNILTIRIGNSTLIVSANLSIFPLTENLDYILEAY